MRKKNISIKKRKEIEAIFKEKCLLKTKGFKVFYRVNDFFYSRILITFPKIFKGAVKRNKIRRLFEEVFRKEVSFSDKFFDFVFVIYPEFSILNYLEIKSFFKKNILINI